MLEIFKIDEFGCISMQSIRRGECPRELEPADRRTRVHVELNRLEDDYKVRIFSFVSVY